MLPSAWRRAGVAARSTPRVPERRAAGRAPRLPCPRCPPLQGIEDHFLEQWHQKLHTNTTPEDVTICEAYLAFLRSGTMDEFWWAVGRAATQALQAALQAACLPTRLPARPTACWHSGAAPPRPAHRNGLAAWLFPCRRVAWERGHLTPERLASMDHPITCEGRAWVW